MRSFVFPQLGKEVIKNNQVKLPQLNWVKLKLSRPIPDGFIIKQARVVRNASGYFVQLSLQLDVNVPDVPFHGHPLGIDICLESFLATSDSQLIPRPKFFNLLHRKLKLRQRRLKVKKLGSNNRNKLNSKIARLHQKISDTRKDFHFKTAYSLCKNAGAIFVEDIDRTRAVAFRDFRTWAKGMLGHPVHRR
jgi:putative transposase